MPVNVEFTAHPSEIKTSLTLPDFTVTGATELISVGETAVLTGVDSGNGNLLVAQKVTVTRAGVVEALAFHVRNVAGQLYLALYDDNGPNGNPGTLLAATAVFAPVTGWNTRPLSAPPSIPAGDYWLAYHPSSNSLSFSLTNTSGQFRYVGRTFSPLPATFPTTVASGTGHWSFYMTMRVPVAASQPPTITAVSPSGGQSGTAVIITGTNFTTGATVTFGGVAATNVTVVSSTQLTCAAPAHANGQVSVVVTTAAGASNSAGWTYSSTGVTLRAIDGGPNYYANNGFTYAAARGWDSPDFVPIGLWLAPLDTQADVNRWLDLGLNTAFGLASGNLAVIRNNGLSCFIQSDNLNGFGTFGPEVVGLLTWDEAREITAISQPIQTTAAALQNGRLWWTNLDFPPLKDGSMSGQPLAQALNTTFNNPAGAPRKTDFFSFDFYWYANWNQHLWLDLGSDVLYTPDPLELTADQMQHSQHYGLMVDWMRHYCGSGRPILNYVEDCGGGEAPGGYITPPQLNAAVWNSIIHGARGIIYFNHSFGPPGSPNESNDALADTYCQTIQPGQTVSLYQQVKATNAQVKAIAAVINSPFADGFVTVSPPAPQVTIPNGGDFTFTPDSGRYSGVDVMAKYDGTSYWVFASNRSGGVTNATFTLNGISSGSVEVYGEGRSIPIVGGQFADTFADRNSVHIYHVT